MMNPEGPSSANLRPRRILISGGTSGIGLTAATYLAVTDDVWILGSTPESTQRAVDSAGVHFVGASTCDLTRTAEVGPAVDDAIAQLGGLDAVFLNAGVDGEARSATELSLDHFRHVLEVNVLGTFAMAQAAISHLSRPGTLLLNASVNAVKPEPGFLDYNASKAAVVSMAKSLALELSHEQITVIALCPGYFPTRMTQPYFEDPETREGILSHIPAGRFGELSEIASTVDFLLSPGARFMHGGVVTLDGGTHL